MFKNYINLTWAPPEKDGGTKILGYQLEKRKKDTNQWVTLNQVNDPIQGTFLNTLASQKHFCNTDTYKPLQFSDNMNTNDSKTPTINVT